MWNKELTDKYYESHSIIANDEYSGMFLMLLESLKSMKFKLSINDPNLNSTDYWSFVIPAKVVFSGSPQQSKQTSIGNSPSPIKPVETSVPIALHSKKKKVSKVQRRSIKVAESPSDSSNLSKSKMNSYNEEEGRVLSFNDNDGMVERSETPEVLTPNVKSSSVDDLPQRQDSSSSLEKNKQEETIKNEEIELKKEDKELIREDKESESIPQSDSNSVQNDIQENNETESNTDNEIKVQNDEISNKEEPDVTESKDSPLDLKESPLQEENLPSPPLDETTEKITVDDGSPSKIIESTIDEENKLNEDDVKNPDLEIKSEALSDSTKEIPADDINNENTDTLDINETEQEIPIIQFMDIDDLMSKLSKIRISNIHRNMIRDLHNSIDKIYKNNDTIETYDLEKSVDFLYHLEVIFTDRVKKSSLLKQWTFLSDSNVDKAAALWSCISRLKEVLPEGGIVVDETKRKSLTSPQGLARSFIHASLNRKELKIHLESILKIKDSINDMYDEESIIHNEELMNIVFELLDVLSNFDFRLNCEDKEFDSIGFYRLKRKEFLLNSGNIRKSSSNLSLHDSRRSTADSFSTSIISSGNHNDVFSFSESVESNDRLRRENSNSYLGNSFNMNGIKIMRSNDDQLDSYGSITNISSPTHFYLSPTTPSNIESHSQDNEDIKQVNHNNQESFSPESISDSQFNVYGKSFINPRYRTTDFSPVAKTHAQSHLSLYKTKNEFSNIKNRYTSDKNILKELSQRNSDNTRKALTFSNSSNNPDDISLPPRILSHKIIPEYNPSETYLKVKNGINSPESSSDVYRINASGIHEIEQHITKFRNANPLDFFLFDDTKKKPFTKKLAVCPDCEKEIDDNKYRWCTYTGSYFCTSCHTNKTSIIPSRILNDWDFKEYKVSNFAISHIQNNKYLPVIDIKEIKGEFWHLSSPPAIGKIHKLREKITRMSQFLRTCRLSESQLELLDSRKHFIWSSTTWSLNDLVELYDGKLRPLLEKIEQSFRNHVLNCEICKGKGFYCEICKSEEILFPFFNNISKCEKCKSIFHKECFKSVTIKCPKCERIELMKSKREELKSSM